jgi:hypothetical protein
VAAQRGLGTVVFALRPGCGAAALFSLTGMAETRQPTAIRTVRSRGAAGRRERGPPKEESCHHDKAAGRGRQTFISGQVVSHI